MLTALLSKLSTSSASVFIDFYYEDAFSEKTVDIQLGVDGKLQLELGCQHFVLRSCDVLASRPARESSYIHRLVLLLGLAFSSQTRHPSIRAGTTARTTYLMHCVYLHLGVEIGVHWYASSKNSPHVHT
jgi:hypothetical protein